MSNRGLFFREYGEELAEVICDDENDDFDYQSSSDWELEDFLNSWGYYWHRSRTSWLHEEYLQPNAD